MFDNTRIILIGTIHDIGYG